MADEWSPPSGVTPQQYRQEPSGGVEALLNMVDRQRRELDEMRSSPLKTAGIGVEPDLLRIAGSLVVEGDLSVPNGAIRNEFLESPVEFGHSTQSVSAFGLTNGVDTDIATVTIPVPAGYTRAVVTGLGSLFFLNPTASVEYVRARVYIDSPSLSTWGIRLLSMVGPDNGSAALSPNWTTEFSGLSGGILTLRLACRTDFAAISSSSNLASLSGSATFLR